jgi:signal transduction histidine kinase/DNA-binding response OmpR family regulator
MSQSKKLKILVCEADLRVLTRLESWVIAIGEEVIVSSDGIAAFEIFKQEQPDIVLISPELTKMGGLELLQKIKERVPNQATILMLSDSDSSIFKQSIELNVDKYLNKPVEAKLLFQAVESLSEEKVRHQEFVMQKRVLQDYKDAIDLSFSVSRHTIDGEIIYVNDLFCATTKLSLSDAMQGKINPLKNENEDMQAVWERLHDERMYRGRQIFLPPNGKEYIIDVTAVALTDESDEVYEYLVFLDDVSDIIHSARKIKNQELNSRLEKLNHAKELNRVKDSFLTIFTHELKTPLNSIINFSEYVIKHLEKETFAKKERLLTQSIEINRSGHFMLTMISNLIEAMKLRDTKIKLEIAEVDINTLLDISIKDNLKNVENIKVLNETEEFVIIYSDESRVRQMLDNIISNAVKYAKSKVEIRASMSEDSFKIIIEDDGSGFSNTENIFDIFEQADSDSMTREATGTGVGLYIVKQLCDRMAYKIDLMSSETLGGAKVIIRGKKDIR